MLLATTGLLAVMQAAQVQAQGCGGTSCTIQGGSSAFSQILVPGANYSFTNNGAFSVTSGITDSPLTALQFIASGGDGTNSSSAPAGSGKPAFALTFVNNGSVIHNVPAAPQGPPAPQGPLTVFSVYGASAGGNGGNYTNSDAKHDAGAAAAGADAAMLNTATITVSTSGALSSSPVVLSTGAALLVQSLGGNGGNVQPQSKPDSNGNPTYDAHNGTPGAAAGRAGLNNTGAITANLPQPLMSEWYWGAAARSLGGNGGTGNDGTAGGAGGQAAVSNTANVSVSFAWGKPAGSTPAPAALGGAAVVAVSQGGNGIMSVNGSAPGGGGVDGGAGGNAADASVFVSGQNRPITITLATANPTGLASSPFSAAVAAISLGGVGGAGYNQSTGGRGGDTGFASVTGDSGVTVNATGDRTRGILALSQGGAGGRSGVGQDNSRAGSGGAAGFTSTNSPQISLSGTTISTTGLLSAGVMAANLGGAGGNGQPYDSSLQFFRKGESGTAGFGGATGPVLVQITGGSVTTTGDQSPGVVALAQGGLGGTGGAMSGQYGGSGTGGDGGLAGTATINIQGNAIITTSGGPATGNLEAAYGVSAASIGGAGGAGGSIATNFASGRGNGGFGGDAQNVTVALAAGVSITTGGASASAVAARSLGGAGGAASPYVTSGIGGSKDGNGGDGGRGGAVSVTNAATLRTGGTAAHGILAQSIGGLGGNGANGSGFFDGNAGSGGNSGAPGSVNVSNSGRINTTGTGAFGIQAQSIGGGAGSGGAANGGIVAFGGSGGTAIAGGATVVTNAGTIVTSGNFALGILAQSIGGGGGNGGDSQTIFTSIGGTGSSGGAGGATTVTQSGSSISTNGRLAYGLVAQSIGGGGGNGGDASATGAFVTLAIGGTASDGGAGGAVLLNLSNNPSTGSAYSLIGTSGSNAGGILAQSIGGGGGAAGAGYATAVGAGFAVATALGGTGGKGGDGGSVTVTLPGIRIATGQATAVGVNTNPVDAFGIHAQSIGGGGGIGGAATAQAIAIPIQAAPSTVLGASISSALGGSGGAAGNGAGVTLSLTGGSIIRTQGQGSHGVLLQSIGGGGGAGGDSSAMATTAGYGRAITAAGSTSFTLEASISLGGGSGSAGNGGSVTATLGSTTPDGSSISTFGDYANGLVAQSVGGGGGNAGIGSSTTASFGNTNNATMSLGLGGRGGSGGTGGDVTVTINPQSQVQTYGASAIGVLAQSIGGGGGTSQGGTLNLGASISPSDAATTYSGNLTINLGTNGSSGGNGGAVTTTMQGQIITAGNDAAGVVLQSIGGGGGIAGSAGSDASSDNPISTLTGLRSKITDKIEGNSTEGYVADISIGGRGGGGGVGGTVTYSQAGSITTYGDWSHGLVAQSIGGGGGLGGAATSASSGASYSATFAVGGSGGSGGAGGAVNLTFGPASRIVTGVAGGTGYAAFGVLAQSIGGGGGVGADGSVGSTGDHNIGGSGRSGGPGLLGSGSSVTIIGTANIVTRGDVAVGMLLQSIGGGGGVSGSGSSASAALGRVSGATQIQVGGRNGVSGDGGTVSVGTAASPASLTILTSGANAFGLLAQSIGGGGGFGFSTGQTDSTTNLLGASSTGTQSVGNGGAVTLNLTGGNIQTTGLGAHGIIAQSIGGGGGIAGLPTGTANLSFAGGIRPDRPSPNGAGGAVTINSSTPITTTGAFAYGILAQSISGGGGLFAQSATQVFAGSTSAGGVILPGTGQAISITQSAPITVSGFHSVGIFAQSSFIQPGPVTVNVSSAIQGGSGLGGWGIWVDGGTSTSTVTVAPGGSVSALSGLAIRMSQGSVTNNGTVTGGYNIDGTTGTFNNNGTLNAGPSLVAAQLVNTGTVLIGALEPHGVSAVSGNFTQRSSGRLLFDADFSNRRSDVMTVAGSADLAGRVRPLISSVLPQVEIPFLTVAGPVTGTLEGERTAIFSYNVNRKGGAFTVSANADFTPAGYSLNRNVAAVANHLQGAWDAGGAGLGPLFALLGNTADAGGQGAYAAALRQISPNGSLAPGARVAAGARSFANAAMSCPQFDGTTAMLREGECVWAGLTGRTAAQSSGDGLSSFRLNSMTWQAGGQWAMGGGWFLGGSIAYENTRLSTTEGLNSGRGQAGYAAVTTKYQTGPWLLAGAVFGGGGEFNSTRTITLPGFGGIARGSPALSNVGAMLRGTYTLGGEELYLRPSMTLSLVHARSGAYRESGAGVLNLEMSGASSTVATLTPALEVGGRATLSNGVVLRLYTSAGVSLLSEGRWNQEGRMVSAPGAAGRFSSVVRTDQVVGRFAAGMQVFATDRLELRLQYEGEYSANLTGHGGSLALAYRF
ncbi:autotransporter outer membrane beta-barrel domain-containing protein [Sediminicoccus sp. KRV36]|uniref:autotransporter outer membrane beta-barrel domain-containing protein n=1 Tax=Sediminicoccus sp. KRV36 TaxID=3133721 RepID=UPI00200F7C4D|nr:autotransporter outer membrane beta-barrel domain-containing protein [Sediminicoccus rosea]UPY36284.1 autotransporter outer membrane beta-barrel domain-containing protein [Sediminicoccus rosea]